ncbi:MAG: hypothetical protein L6W00_03530 [Lentisphaeria bacterium]|nr:MAG: hypothetical protein L6W00_03530 [Lentisphaeria bacterium]
MSGKRHIVRKRSVLLEYSLLVCSILPLVFAASASVYSLRRLVRADRQGNRRALPADCDHHLSPVP